MSLLLLLLLVQEGVSSQQSVKPWPVDPSGEEIPLLRLNELVDQYGEGGLRNRLNWYRDRSSDGSCRTIVNSGSHSGVEFEAHRFWDLFPHARVVVLAEVRSVELAASKGGAPLTLLEVDILECKGRCDGNLGSLALRQGSFSVGGNSYCTSRFQQMQPEVGDVLLFFAFREHGDRYRVLSPSGYLIARSLDEPVGASRRWSSRIAETSLRSLYAGVEVVSEEERR